MKPKVGMNAKVALIAISLLVNATFVWLKLRPSPESSPERSAKTRSVSPSSKSELGFLNLAPSVQEVQKVTPEQMAREMRAAGYHGMVIANALWGAYMDETGYADLRVRARSSEQARLKFAELDKEIIKKVAEATADIADSPYGARMQELEGLTDKIAYGDLSSDKLTQLKALEAQYAARFSTLAGTSKDVAASRELYAEFLTDLGGVLSPEEKDAYMLFNSTAFYSPVLQVQTLLNTTELSEDEYKIIARKALELDATSRKDGVILSSAVWLDTMFDTFRQSIGDERLVRILSYFNPTAASADSFFSSVGSTPQQQVNAFRIASNALKHTGGDLDRPHQTTTAEHAWTRIIAELGLTPEQEAEFRKTSLGGQLDRTRSTP